MSAPVRVRGAATVEEIAAVLAALSRRDDDSDHGGRDGSTGRADDGAPSGYEQWRRRRLRAMRNTARPS